MAAAAVGALGGTEVSVAFAARRAVYLVAAKGVIALHLLQMMQLVQQRRA